MNPIFKNLPSIKKKLGSRIFVSRTKYFNGTINKYIRDCATILDLGCGYHSPLLDCDIQGKTVIGMDACDDYLEKAQNNPDKNTINTFIPMFWIWINSLSPKASTAWFHWT